MQTKELQTLSLPCTIGGIFSSSWSDDNRIATVTQKGVYIMEMHPDPQSDQLKFSFENSLVKPSTAKPTADPGVDINNMIWKLDRVSVYRMVMDSSLAPNLENCDYPAPYVIQASWSPVGIVPYNRCMLATVTNYGAVVFHISRMKKWLEIVNLSCLWRKHLEKSWPNRNTTQSGRLFETLEERTQPIKTTAITWSKLMQAFDETWAFFCMGQRTGDIVVWKMMQVNNMEPPEPHIAVTFSSELKRITTLCWRSISESSGFLCVGSICGRIKLFRIEKDENEETGWSHTHVSDPWPECDRIQVSKIICMDGPQNRPGSFYLTISKGSFVIAVALNEDGTVFCKASHNVGKLVVTGLGLYQAGILACARNGTLNYITCEQDMAEKLSLKAIQINTNFDLSNVACFGLTSSVNKIVWVLVTSVNKLYDHLVLREPTMLNFFTLTDYGEPLNALCDNKNMKLYRFWDCLELLRIQSHQTDVPLWEIDVDNLDEKTDYYLRFSFWLITIRIHAEEDEVKLNALMKAHSNIENHLMSRHICNLFESALKQGLEPNSLQRRSLSVLCKWLETHDHQKNAALTRAIRKLVGCKEEQLPEEKCAVCDEEVILESFKYGKCASGHTFPRCSLSLLMCDTVPYRLCSSCKSVAHKEIVFKEQLDCLYCEGPLNFDENFLTPGCQQRKSSSSKEEQNDDIMEDKNLDEATNNIPMKIETPKK